MRPIINITEEDRATDIGNMHKKFGKDGACGSGDILADIQTDRQTDILITIVRSRGRNSADNAKCLNFKLRKT